MGWALGAWGRRRGVRARGRPWQGAKRGAPGPLAAAGGETPRRSFASGSTAVPGGTLGAQGCALWRPAAYGSAWKSGQGRLPKRQERRSGATGRAFHGNAPRPLRPPTEGGERSRGPQERALAPTGAQTCLCALRGKRSWAVAAEKRDNKGACPCCCGTGRPPKGSHLLLFPAFAKELGRHGHRQPRTFARRCGAVPAPPKRKRVSGSVGRCGHRPKAPLRIERNISPL